MEALLGRGASTWVDVEVRAVFSLGLDLVLRAHHALGRMSACSAQAEFAEMLAEFLECARGLSDAIGRVGNTSLETNTDGADAFSRWLGDEVSTLRKHPLQTEVLSSTSNGSAIVVSRLARGSGPPPLRDESAATRRAPPRPRAEHFFFEVIDKRPAIELCAEYVDRVSSILDESRQRLKLLGHS